MNSISLSASQSVSVGVPSKGNLTNEKALILPGVEKLVRRPFIDSFIINKNKHLNLNYSGTQFSQPSTWTFTLDLLLRWSHIIAWRLQVDLVCGRSLECAECLNNRINSIESSLVMEFLIYVCTCSIRFVFWFC